MCAKIEHFHLWKQQKEWFSLIKPICNLQNIFDILLHCITAFGALYAGIKCCDTHSSSGQIWTSPSPNLYSSQVCWDYPSSSAPDRSPENPHYPGGWKHKGKTCGKPWSRGLIKAYSEYFWGKWYTFKELTLSRRKPNTNLHFCEVFNAMPILSKIWVYLTAYFWKVGKQQLS